ncbi:MAG TPA: hypothetical protein PK280_18230 [Planctomycetota bacterium]|nr:hypothetical protein [Planctomycetota bacterium]
MRWTTGGLVTIVLALAAGVLGAGEPAKADHKGPLAMLLGAPGAHLEKIEALGDNEWLDLGALTPSP